MYMLSLCYNMLLININISCIKYILPRNYIHQNIITMILKLLLISKRNCMLLLTFPNPLQILLTDEMICLWTLHYILMHCVSWVSALLQLDVIPRAFIMIVSVVLAARFSNWEIKTHLCVFYVIYIDRCPSKVIFHTLTRDALRRENQQSSLVYDSRLYVQHLRYNSITSVWL